MSRRRLAAWGWFSAWTLLGAAFALGTVSLGPLVLVPLALVAAFMFARPGIRQSAFGLVSGAGVLLLYVAYVQRDGPGTTCWHRGLSSGCDQHLNPLPWLVLGVVFLVGGIVGQATRGR